jgi:deazaflavin-dependent oxidoreductase (nitroreductase family)
MPIPNKVRAINKRFTNPILRLIAGRAHSPIALITHIGRRSGKIYFTPIMVERSRDGFVFALTYGIKVDWYQNVMAAGRCLLLWHGREYALENPRELDQASGLASYPNPQRFILKKVGIWDFFEMNIQI